MYNPFSTAKELYEQAVAKLDRRSPDLRGAILQVKEAADKGYIPAKIKLAWSYIYGEGVELDVQKAKAIFEELAEQGNADAHAVSVGYKLLSSHFSIFHNVLYIFITCFCLPIRTSLA